ncbi:MAG: PIN domain-containing protein [Elusimicrobia bacterium]|nr:PIN domain-containing protein [Elusimicrobiota bacterium]
MANDKDDFHAKAVHFLDSLEPDAILVTSLTVLAEFLSVVRARVGAQESVRAQEMILDDKRIIIENHRPEDTSEAADLFRHAPRHASFVDCLNVAVMKRLGIKDIFTFDPWFRERLTVYPHE